MDQGQTLGKYTNLEQIGTGGFSTVFKARDTELDRTVALKLLEPILARDLDFMRRFRREAQTAAKLNHPNIVTIFEVGEAEGQPFIAMEYLPGAEWLACCKAVPASKISSVSATPIASGSTLSSGGTTTAIVLRPPAFSLCMLPAPKGCCSDQQGAGALSRV